MVAPLALWSSKSMYEIWCPECVNIDDYMVDMSDDYTDGLDTIDHYMVDMSDDYTDRLNTIDHDMVDMSDDYTDRLNTISIFSAKTDCCINYYPNNSLIIWLSYMQYYMVIITPFLIS